METRIRVLLLTLVVTLTSGCASLPWPFHRHKHAAPAAGDANGSGTADAAAASSAEAAAVPPTVIEPEVQRRKIKVPKIKSQNVEIGGYYGEISIEDFTSVPVKGARFAYHVTEDFFLQADVGRAQGGKTSFETLGGNVQLLTNAERQFTFYNLSLGYNFLPGEVFLGRNLTMTSGLYLLGGLGSVKFAGNQNFTVNFGAGFQVLPTDWLAIHIEAQDLVFKSDLLGVSRLKNNLTANLGATVFF